MEASLGIDFLERGRRGVTPAPAGTALAQHARLLLQHADRLQQDLAEYAKGVKGQVRLLCNTTAITEYLPEVLADSCRHPNLDIDLQELPSAPVSLTPCARARPTLASSPTPWTPTPSKPCPSR